MFSAKHRQAWIFFGLGVVVAFLAVYAIAITSAIAAPAAFFDWFKSRNMVTAGIFLWQLVVVFGPGLGLTSFLALLAAFRFMTQSPVWLAGLFVAGLLLTLYVVIPIVYDQPVSRLYLRPVHGFALELSLVIATASALLLARRLWPNDSFKPNQLRGSA